MEKIFVKTKERKRIILYLMYGMCNYNATGHVYYKMGPIDHYIDEKVSFQLVLGEWKKDIRSVKRDYRSIEQFLWNRFAQLELKSLEDDFRNLKLLEPYVHHTYNWAFNNWNSVCWQEFNLNSERVGIVTAKQKLGEGAENQWREKRFCVKCWGRNLCSYPLTNLKI
ncbi:hypothetical protein ACTWP4_01195 [Gracilibacillus sp. D59]|uniref:hypothetical protein n=1 Tax=Gracilibacillus sp. D59 TaxID=3457434 RepID=UPI003FCC6E63